MHIQKLASATNITFINYTRGFIKSFWFANFLTAEDGHDYCVVACLSTIGLDGVKAYTVKPLYNDTTYLADRIVIPRVSLYLVFVYKMHQKLKLGNDIIYLHL